MGELIDFAKSRRAKTYWGGMVVLKPEGTDVVAEMLDFWGDDQREPSFRLEMWASALEDLARQMRQTATDIQEPTQ